MIFDIEDCLLNRHFKALKTNITIKLVYLFLSELIIILVLRVLFIKYGDISPVVKCF